MMSARSDAYSGAAFSILARIGLLAGLVFCGCTEERAEYYIDYLSDSDRQVRLEASRNLVQFGGSTVEPLIKRATGGSDSLLYIAAQILGQIGDQRAAPFLKELIHAPNRYVREQAVRALGQLDDPRLIPTLEQVLTIDPVTDVRGAAAWSMGNLRDTTAVAPLIQALTDTAALVRQHALAAVQYLWTPAAESATIAALRDPNPTVRYIAAQMLGHHRTIPALNELCLTLLDDSIGVRTESARALGLIGDTTAVGPLERLLAERDGPDHDAAKEALRLLTGLEYVVTPE
jgi:HEAT repeat protein